MIGAGRGCQLEECVLGGTEHSGRRVCYLGVYELCRCHFTYSYRCLYGAFRWTWISTHLFSQDGSAVVN